MATITILTGIRTKFYLLNLNGTNWKMHAQMGRAYSNNLQRSWVWQCELDSPKQHRLRTNGGCCERGNEYLGSINSGKVLGQVISNYCLLMDASTHYRRLATAYTLLFHFSHPRFTIVLVQTCLAAEPFWFPKHLTVHHINDNANSCSSKL